MKMSCFKFRRSIALILCVCILSSFFSITSAATDIDGTANEVYEKIALFVSERDRKGVFNYSYVSSNNGNVSGRITKNILQNGTINIVCEENGKTDYIVISNDGSIYLNEKRIGVESSVNTVVMNEPIITPYAHHVEILDNPPDGTTAAQFNVLLETQDKNIQLYQDLLNITESGLIAVIVAAFGFNPLGAFGATFFLSKLLDFGTVHPEGITSLSTRTYVYQHKNGPIISGYGSVTKLYTKWYANKNQKNYITGADTVVYRSMTW